MTAPAEQRLITSGTPAGFANPAGGRTVRNALLSLVLLLLIGLAVVQRVAVEDRGWQWDSIGRATPGIIAAAAVQTVVGVALASVTYSLMPRAGLWVVLAGALVALYPAAIVWPTVVMADHAQGWVWAPFMALLTLATLDAIPSIVHEAAAVDRAGGWFKLRTITLPLVAPLVLLGVAFVVASGFRRADARIVAAAYALLLTAIVVGSGLARGRR
jgi:multiple sugar transport system permease protein